MYELLHCIHAVPVPGHRRVANPAKAHDRTAVIFSYFARIKRIKNSLNSVTQSCSVFAACSVIKVRVASRRCTTTPNKVIFDWNKKNCRPYLTIKHACRILMDCSCFIVQSNKHVAWTIVFMISLLIGAIPDVGEFLTILIIILVTSFQFGRLVCCQANEQTRTTTSDENNNDAVVTTDTSSSTTPFIDVNNEEKEFDRTHSERQESATTSANDVLELPPSSLSQVQKEANSNIVDEEEPADGNSSCQTIPEQPRHAVDRLFFLDNLKIFLTALVVAVHVTCGYGGCGASGWFLIIGLYDNPFQHNFANGFVTLNQCFFMPLFFFISAYFLPQSYERKGQERFLHDRARRLWIPAILATFVIVPLCFLVSEIVGATNSKSDNSSLSLIYLPHPGHCWFLYWLLMMNWCYSSFYSSTTALAGDTSCENLPSTRLRMCTGILICGIAMLAVIAILRTGTFASMPLVYGSLTCDIFMFYLGILAYRHDWFRKEGREGISHYLRDQLDMPIWILRIMVILEGVGIVILMPKAANAFGYAIAAFAIAGLFCLDMSLVLLDFFQIHMDFENALTRFLRDASYSVYIFHPMIVVLLTAGFIWVYNHIILDESSEQQLLFEHGGLPPVFSKTELIGAGKGATTLAIAWAVLAVLNQLVIWPLAWCIKKFVPSIF